MVQCEGKPTFHHLMISK